VSWFNPVFQAKNLPSVYNNACFLCQTYTKQFSFTEFSSLNKPFTESTDNYFCTFDKVCRAPSDPNMSYRSCERGISACLLYASENQGTYVIDEDRYLYQKAK